MLLSVWAFAGRNKWILRNDEQEMCVCVCVVLHIKSIASVYFSLRVALVFVFIVCLFIYASLLGSYYEPGTVLGLEI